MTATTANSAQWQAWDGATGTFWTDHADDFDRGVAAYDPALLAGLAPGDRVLDVGCGTGFLTRAAAGRVTGTGSAHGVDLSGRMLDLARARAAHLPTVSFTQADAQVHPFPPGSFDVVLSRHGAMFFDDPVAAFTNLATALRTGGRIVLLVWQAFDRNPFLHNVLAAIAPERASSGPPADGRPSPMSLSDPDRARGVLTAAGFTGIRVRAEEQDMDFGPTPDVAFDYLSAQHADLIAEQDPAGARDRLRADIERHHQPGRGVRYPSACWLITARRADDPRA